ncbi:MAG TPA: amidase [Mycobacteriales bacterium]|nr:amidase [Mycobacteriales bacterium]
MDNDLTFVSAVELAQRIRARELSAREVLTAHLARIEAVNPLLNAVVSLDAEGALRRAAELDEILIRSGPVGILHGLPVAHKDLLLTAGMRTTFGSPLYATFVPDRDALPAERMRLAGAVRVGKTNVPEFGAGSQTHNPVFGRTRNPYDPSLTCGGSSGGAAVALATGMVALADGSDMGGSLRNPASFCNVFGLRPTPGRVPNVPVKDAWFDLSVVGPMGRYAADAALLLAAISGPDPRDPLSLPEPGASLLQAPLARDFRGVRVAWGADLGGLPFAAEVLAAFEATRPGVASLGVALSDAEPDLRGADEVFRVLRGWQMATTLAADVARAGPDLSPMVRENVAFGHTLTAADVAAAQQQRTAIVHRAGAFWAAHEFLLLPVSQVLPFDVETPWVGRIGEHSMPDYLGWMRSAYLISVLRVPAASVPAGFTAGGLPVGLQVIGRPGDDWGVLQFAHALEGVFQAGDRHPDPTAGT